MAIYDHNPDSKRLGVLKHRVVRMVDGKSCQFYYTSKSQAEVKDLELRFAQLDAQRKRRFIKRNPTMKSEHSTLISGISMRYSFDIKRRTGIKTCITINPCFAVSSSYEGKFFAKVFNIRTLGMTEAWERAIHYLAIHKQAKVEELDELLKLSPPPFEMWLLIHKNTETRKKTLIDLNKLPKELIVEFGLHWITTQLRGTKAQWRALTQM